MRKLHQVAAVCALGFTVLTANATAEATAPKQEETGKDIAFNRAKGNCLACHGMPTAPDAESAGLFGLP